MQPNNTMHYGAVYNVQMLTMTSELAQRQIFMGLGLVGVWRSERCPSAWAVVYGDEDDDDKGIIISQHLANFLASFHDIHI